mgnify:CR=1 FL=1|jgi:ferredoxin|tara:strand:+ start:7914 stop:8120 length:207 start_codon:yes stop_codon:yes gene_type:complete
MAKYKVEVTDECIGCRACVGVAEELFEIDEATNKAKPKKEEIDDSDLEKAKEAEDACPVDAIKVKKVD